MSFAVVEALIVPAGAGGSGPLSVSSLVAEVRLVYPEDRAVPAVAIRSGRISHSALRGAVQGLGHLSQLMDMVEVSDGIGRRAGALAESHFLQGYDAAHLASAETLIDEASFSSQGMVVLSGRWRMVARRSNYSSEMGEWRIVRVR